MRALRVHHPAIFKELGRLTLGLLSVLPDVKKMCEDAPYFGRTIICMECATPVDPSGAEGKVFLCPECYNVILYGTIVGQGPPDNTFVKSWPLPWRWLASDYPVFYSKNRDRERIQFVDWLKEQYKKGGVPCLPT